MRKRKLIISWHQQCVMVLWLCCVSIVKYQSSDISIMWYRLCFASIVSYDVVIAALVLWYWRCGTGCGANVVALVLWYRRCGTGLVVLEFWYKRCGTGFVVLVLRQWRCVLALR